MPGLASIAAVPVATCVVHAESVKIFTVVFASAVPVTVGELLFAGDVGVTDASVGAAGAVLSTPPSWLPLCERHTLSTHSNPGGHASFGPHWILPSSNFGEKQADEKMTTNQQRKANFCIIRVLTPDRSPSIGTRSQNTDGIICELTAAM